MSQPGDYLVGKLMELTLERTPHQPVVVRRQGGSRFLYLSESGAVVLDDVGQVVTVWNRAGFSPRNEQILLDALGGG